MKQFLKHFVTNRGAVIGASIFLLVILMGLTCSVLFEESPWMMVAQPLLLPFQDSQYWLGTDMLGRDIAAGLAYGARVSLLVGVVSTLVAVLVGVLIGAAAGFWAAGCAGWAGRSPQPSPSRWPT